MFDDPAKLGMLRALDNLRSGESRRLDFSCAERRSGVDRVRVGEVVTGGGDDGIVEVGECRNELPCSCDIVRVEAVEDETVCVTDVDARASQEIGELSASGDAGFRRSASGDEDEFYTQIRYNWRKPTWTSENRPCQPIEHLLHSSSPGFSEVINLRETNIIGVQQAGRLLRINDSIEICLQGNCHSRKLQRLYPAF